MDNICRFGRAHYGKPWSEVPTSYLRWMLENVTSPAYLSLAARLLRERTEPRFDFDELTEDQRYAGTLIEARGNVGITGAAGCGKSFIVKNITNKLLLCPTGISAINAGGQTFHSFFRINPSDPLLEIKLNAGIPEKLIVFDEIFFTSPVLLDNVLRQCPELKEKQLIFTGDPYQLPPIKFKNEDDDNEDYSEEDLKLIENNVATSKGSFFDVLDKHGINVNWVELTKSVRHKDDPIFADALSRVRLGVARSEDLALLNTRIVKRAPEDALVLTFRKALVREYNDKYLQSFAITESFDATAFDDVPEDKRGELWYKKEKKRLRKPPAPFVVAFDASVVVLYNDPKANGQRFVNGDLGTVVEYANNPEETTFIDVEIIRTGEIVTFYPDRVIKGKKYMGYRGFGLAVAKAMTIHKSQGCTIYGNVHIHIDAYLATRWHGALYTAVSRCRRLDQLTFNQKVSKGYLKQDTKILRYENANPV